MLSDSCVLDSLSISDMRLIFVDDGGTSGKPLLSLSSDYQLFTGVKLKPGVYADVCASMSEKLIELDHDIDEFHAHEIVNPGTGSRWRKIDRIAVVEYLSNALDKFCEKIYFCHINGDQFPELLNAAQLRRSELNLSQKEALRKVFMHGLIYAEKSEGLQPIRIVVDSEMPLNGQIKVQDFDDSLGIDGKVIHADSRLEFGLQLADFAAYVVNRIFHVRERFAVDKNGPMDAAIAAAYSRLNPLIANILDLPLSLMGRTGDDSTKGSPAVLDNPSAKS